LFTTLKFDIARFFLIVLSHSSVEKRFEDYALFESPPIRQIKKSKSSLCEALKNKNAMDNFHEYLIFTQEFIIF